MIYGWSIPAVVTCPWLSHLCRDRCYARAGHFRWPNVSQTHQRNWEFSRDPGFAQWMRDKIASDFVRVMRVHVAGDFYDVDYIRKWQDIVRRSPHTTFFAYTRSWRGDDLLPELVALASHRNMCLWWSIDRETGPAPLVRGVRRAYMAIDDVDVRLAPDDCDLIFRSDTKTVMKRGNGHVLVCPTENGVTENVTCSKCGICWDRKQRPAWEAALPAIAGKEINAP